MKIDLDNLNIKKVNAQYPIGYIDNFISEENCKKLFDEIYAFDAYDDLVMNGRMRVNKGSQKFKNYLKNSPNLFSLYSKLNNQELFLSMKEKLNALKKENSWYPELEDFNFSKEGYGEQKFDLIKYFRKSWFISKFFKKTINLDVDFSRSKKGYFRKAHRDRDTRIISFLLYLNTIDKKLGGEFEIYKTKEQIKDIAMLKRFPESDKISLVEKFPPKAGQLFLFVSTPDSYHGVSEFLTEKQDRVFIYGSYSLDRKVNWKNQWSNN